MRVKEFQCTANTAWGPQHQKHGALIACGTSAQQLDASFSTSSCLDVCAVNLRDPSPTMFPIASVPSELRFHKLAWGWAPGQNGLIVGGADNGHIVVYNMDKAMGGRPPSEVITSFQKHTGSVQALDFNPFNSNLLASGASDSEILIWDMENPSSPMSPGNKMMPPDLISALSWNRQVQHILASTSPCGRTLVWDLRKPDPIIKLNDQSSVARWKDIQWHPEVVTQLLFASEDDRYPVIQMWDLRYATSPLKVIQAHSKGVLSLAWCRQDPDLLLSCGKDNQVLCINPNSQNAAEEVVYTLPASSQWTFEVQWCPSNPVMFSAASFEGKVSIYSLMGSNTSSEDVHNSADRSHAAAQVEPLKKVPKWLKCPMRANFAFGGRLAVASTARGTQVLVHQVITEASFVNRASQLEVALSTGHHVDYCNSHLESAAPNSVDRLHWSLIAARLEEPSTKYLHLLGFGLPDSKGESGLQNDEESSESIRPFLAGSGVSYAEEDSSIDEVNGMASLTISGAVGDLTSSSLSQSSSVLGDFTELKQPEIFIPDKSSVEGRICEAILARRFNAAVDLCLGGNRMADALLMAYIGGQELYMKTMHRYLQQDQSVASKILSCIVGNNLDALVRTTSLECWRHILVALVSYAPPDQFQALCGLLGQRLEQDYPSRLVDASVCYILAADPEAVLRCLIQFYPSPLKPDHVLDILEKVLTLKVIVEHETKTALNIQPLLASKYRELADILASQGMLKTAAFFLSVAVDQNSVSLQDRLLRSLNYSSQYVPFTIIDIKPVPTQAQYGRQASNQDTYHHIGSNYNRGTGHQQQQSQLYSRPQSSTSSQPGMHVVGQVDCRPSPDSYPQPSAGPNYPPHMTTSGYTQPTGGPKYPPHMTTSSYSQASTASMAQHYQGGHGSGSRVQSALPSAGTVHGAQQKQAPNPSASFIPNHYQDQGVPSAHIPPLAHQGYPSTQTIPRGPAPQANTPQDLVVPPPPLTMNTHHSALPQLPSTVSGAQQPSPQWTLKQPAPKMQPGPSAEQYPLYSGQAPSTHYGLVSSQEPGRPYVSAPPMRSNPAYPSSNVPATPQQVFVPGYPGVGQNTNQNFSPQLMEGYPAANVGSGAVQGPSTSRSVVPVASHGTKADARASPLRQEIMKAPIPAEHIGLQHCFDLMVAKCRERASNNLATLKKIDEVSKKLEALYDCLREQTLSQKVLSGLHAMAQICSASDHVQALQLCNSLIGSCSFSEIGTFMPGLKTLLQTASQLHI